MAKSVRAVPSQTVWMVTGPCLPAAVPVMVFVTTNEPGVSKSAVASTMVVRVPVWDRMSFCASVGSAVVEVHVARRDGGYGRGLELGR